MEQTEQQEQKKAQRDLTIPGAILLGSFLIAGAIIAHANILVTGGFGTPAEDQVQRVDIPVTDADRIQGDAQAPITIIEFSDFQCPYCKAFHPIMEQAMQQYSGKIRWVYKQFPLSNIHQHAQTSAEASECVAEQSEEDFWRFANLVFSQQETLFYDEQGQERPVVGAPLYAGIVQQLGLDINAFTSCMDTGRYADKVKQDQDLGIANEVEGTPTLFINGMAVKGAIPFAQLQSIIDAELKN